jgi:hypothetical protein
MSTPPVYVDSTQLTTGNYGKPLVLDAIFKLLAEMITVLQETAAAQASRLQFLASWQKAYADASNDFHTFSADNTDGGSPPFESKGLDDQSDATAVAARSDMNAINTAYQTKYQGTAQVISDDAKALQTSVNQTNDAVQAQTDMATSIIQTASAILTSIYQAA